MMNVHPEVDRLYREGVGAIRAGDRATAKERLLEVIRLDQTHEQAWLWLSGAVDTDEERVICLENVLTINPNNGAARRGLERLGGSANVNTAPSGAPAEVERTDPDPPATPPTPITHAASPIAESLRLAASESQEKPSRSQVPVIAPSGPPIVAQDEAWRASLYAQAPPEENIGVYTRDIKEGRPTTIGDLINAWGNLIFFNAGDDFTAQVKHGSFVHIIVSTIATNVLQLIGLLLSLLVLSTMAQAGDQLPLMRSLTQLPPELSSAIRAALVDPLRDLQTGSVAGMAVGLLIFMGVSIPLLFVATMIQSFFVDLTAHWLQGRGDVMQTWQALSIALVVVQIAQLIVYLASPFMPFQLLLLAWGLFWFYQLVVQGLAVGRAQNMGVFAAMGVIIASGAVMGVLATLLACLVGFLLGAGSA